MAAVAGVAGGIVGAIALAKDAFDGISSLFGGVTDALVERVAGRMSAEEFANKMAGVGVRVRSANDILDPLVKESRDKDADLELGWDPRLTE